MARVSSKRLLMVVMLMQCFRLSSLSSLSSQLEQLEQGRSEYSLTLSRTRLPHHGECWTKAIDWLHAGCDALNSELQMKLALKFTVCLLQTSGVSLLDTCILTDDLDKLEVKECLSDAHMPSYTHFFTHVHNMCFYLKQQVWQASLDDTVDRLGKSSLVVAEWMEESSQLQQEIVHGQRETLQVQRKMAEDGSMINLALEASKSDMKDIVTNFRLQTEEQRMLIFQIFDRVTKLQSMFLSEVSWIYNLVFYGSSLLLVYLFTSSRRTSDARLFLFAILTLNFLLERLVCRLSLPDVSTSDIGLENELTTTLHTRVWMVRQFSVLMCIATILYHAVTFVDFNKVNNRLLEDIRRQNADLKIKMESMQVYNRNDDSVDVDGRLSQPSRGGFVTLLDDSMTETIGSRNDYSDDDDEAQSEMSFTSDRTFLGGNDDGDESQLSSDIDDELDVDEPAMLLHDVGEDFHKNFNTLRPCSRLNDNNNTKGHFYNLRARKAMGPLLESQPTTETVKNFAKMVFQAANVSKRNARKIVMAERTLGTMNKKGMAEYSDDEN